MYSIRTFGVDNRELMTSYLIVTVDASGPLFDQWGPISFLMRYLLLLAACLERFSSRREDIYLARATLHFLSAPLPIWPLLAPSSSLPRPPPPSS